MTAVYRAPSPCHETRRLPMLQKLSTKTPCNVRWKEMSGDERARFCFRCSKNVYDLRAMTEDEAESFLAVHAEHQDRFFRRPDGTILTENCIVGAERRHRFTVFASAIVASVVIAGASLVIADATKRGPRAKPVATASFSRVEPPRRPAAPSYANAYATPPEDFDDPIQRHQQIPHHDPDADMFIGFTRPPVYGERDTMPKLVTVFSVDDPSQLPHEVIQRIVRQSFGRFRACYQREILLYRPYQGAATDVRFVITRDGSVAQVKLMPSDPAATTPRLDQCVGRGFADLSFPAPKTGPATVSYRLVFAPADGL